MNGLTTITTVLASGGTTVAMRGKFTRRDGQAPVIIYHHGNGGNGWESMQAAVFGQYNNIVALVEAGYLVVSGDYGGSLWGSPYNQNAIDEAIAWAQTIGGRTGKVLMMGTSMGGLAALGFTGRYPAKVSAAIAVIPATNLAASAADPLWPNINAAYAGGYSDPIYGLNHSPIVQAQAGLFSTMPIRLWYGTTDTVIPPAYAQAFIAAVGPTCVATALVGGHAESTSDMVVKAELVDFARTYHAL